MGRKNSRKQSKRNGNIPVNTFLEINRKIEDDYSSDEEVAVETSNIEQEHGHDHTHKTKKISWGHLNILTGTLLLTESDSGSMKNKDNITPPRSILKNSNLQPRTTMKVLEDISANIDVLTKQIHETRTEDGITIKYVSQGAIPKVFCREERSMGHIKNERKRATSKEAEVTKRNKYLEMEKSQFTEKFREFQTELHKASKGIQETYAKYKKLVPEPLDDKWINTCSKEHEVLTPEELLKYTFGKNEVCNEDRNKENEDLFKNIGDEGTAFKITVKGKTATVIENKVPAKELNNDELKYKYLGDATIFVGTELKKDGEKKCELHNNSTVSDVEPKKDEEKCKYHENPAFSGCCPACYKLLSQIVSTELPPEDIPEDFFDLQDEPICHAKVVAKETITVAAGMSDEIRVPPIYDPASCSHKKSKFNFLGEEIMEDEDSGHIFLNGGYESMCLKHLVEPEINFITLEPGVFVVGLGLSYTDDFRIMKTIYRPPPETPNVTQVEREIYLMEKKILLHLDNFRTETICNIFTSIIKHTDMKSGYITEFDYMVEMKRIFHVGLPSSYGDIGSYSFKDMKSKFFTGRYSTIRKMYQEQPFR